MMNLNCHFKFNHIWMRTLMSRFLNQLYIWPRIFNWVKVKSLFKHFSTNEVFSIQTILSPHSSPISDILLAEELPAVPAVVASLSEWEANGAAGAGVNQFVLHPVVSCRAAWLLTDRPAENPPAPVTHQDLTVVPRWGWCDTDILPQLTCL